LFWALNTEEISSKWSILDDALKSRPLTFRGLSLKIQIQYEIVQENIDVLNQKINMIKLLGIEDAVHESYLLNQIARYETRYVVKAAAAARAM
jgi:hypothetical protein